MDISFRSNEGSGRLLYYIGFGIFMLGLAGTLFSIFSPSAWATSDDSMATLVDSSNMIGAASGLMIAGAILLVGFRR